jgi:hypothetical protein
MLKLVIGELRMVFRTWDELVGMDGLKAGQGIINEQTIMEWVSLHLVPAWEVVTIHCDPTDR